MAGGFTSGPIVAIGQEIYSSSATPAHKLGERAVAPDGRAYRYCKAGALLTVGNMIQSPAVVTNHVALTPAAAAIGATSVTVTLGNTAATLNQYAGGYLNVNTTPGNGQLLVIESHPAADANATLVVTLASYDAVRTALTTDSRVDLILNPYAGVIQAPVTTLTGTIVGCAVHAIASGEYGWIQTWGAASLLNDGTGIVGSLLGGVPDNAGEAIPFTGVYPIVGSLMKAGLDGLNMPVFLTIS